MIRIGQGFDMHAFAPGCPLRLGGVLVEHDQGLAGHSDGDALLHAIADALLGATGEGDLGQWFPSSDPRLRGIDSSEMLIRIRDRVHALGYAIGNLDTTIIAQGPSLARYFEAMRLRVAEILEIDVNRVSIKAKTPDRLGALGRKEGLAALAIVLLDQRTPRSPTNPSLRRYHHRHRRRSCLHRCAPYGLRAPGAGPDPGLYCRHCRLGHREV